MIIEIPTQHKRQVVDMTSQIESQLKGSGLVNVLALHSTVAVTLADLDPGTDADYLQAIESLTPKLHWAHPHDPGHFPDHLWSALIGQAVTLPFSDGQLTLGTWQRLILLELDGPRARQVAITVVPGR